MYSFAHSDPQFINQIEFGAKHITNSTNKTDNSQERALITLLF